MDEEIKVLRFRSNFYASLSWETISIYSLDEDEDPTTSLDDDAALSDVEPTPLPLEHPRHPQCIHSTTLPSSSFSLGTLHTHVVPKFVSLGWMHRKQQTFSYPAFQVMNVRDQQFLFRLTPCLQETIDR